MRRCVDKPAGAIPTVGAAVPGGDPAAEHGIPRAAVPAPPSHVRRVAKTGAVMIESAP